MKVEGGFVGERFEAEQFERLEVHCRGRPVMGRSPLNTPFDGG
jgi:hypothetical protein